MKSTIIQVWLSLIVRIGVFEPTMIVNKYLRSNGISTIGRSEKTNAAIYVTEKRILLNTSMTKDGENYKTLL